MGKRKGSTKEPAGKHERPYRISMVGTATPAEVERCRVLSRHVERTAGRLPSVRTVREHLLGDPAGTVTPERAYMLLDSPASRYVPLRFFQDHATPWREHACSNLHVRPGHQPGIATYEDVTLTLHGSGNAVLWSGRVTVDDAQGIHRPRTVRYPKPDGTTGTALAQPGTPLDWLGSFAASNAPNLLWSEPEAVWFLLTGQAPAVEPVRYEVRTAYDDKGQPMRTELVFRVQAFLTRESAERALARARRLALRRQGLRGAFTMEPRTLALFSFVEEQTERNLGVRPSWGTLLDLWDAAQRKEWRYGIERSHLRRDYERARRLLTQAPKPTRPARWVSAVVTG